MRCLACLAVLFLSCSAASNNVELEVSGKVEVSLEGQDARVEGRIEGRGQRRKAGKRCYPPPAPAQAEALLRHISNSLGKIFTHTRVYLDEEYPGIYRRFSGALRKNSDVLEPIMATMRKQFLHYYNTSSQDLRRRSYKDVCTDETEIRKLYKDLIDKSAKDLRFASVAFLNKYIDDFNMMEHESVKKKIGRMVNKEVRDVRKAQLRLLCDDFGVCYSQDLFADTSGIVAFFQLK